VREITLNELPSAVRQAAEKHTGSLAGVVPARAGNHAQIAETWHSADGGRVFVKGTRLIGGQAHSGAEAWSLRNEAAIVPHARPYAPELLWRVETDGWLLLGFEHIDGRHADYSPGSPDLELVAEVVAGLGSLRCPDVVLSRVEDRYMRLSREAQVLAGDRMLHCDLNPANVLITSAGARVVDWAFCSRGTQWLEAGFMVPWMIRDGHTPAQAEEWTTRFDSWKAAAEGAGQVDLFAGLLSQAWTARDVDGAAPWVKEYAGVVQAWNDHRQGVATA
jgi:hypothetical protein